MRRRKIIILTGYPSIRTIQRSKLGVTCTIFCGNKALQVRSGVIIRVSTPKVLVIGCGSTNRVLALNISSPAHFVGGLRLSIGREVIKATRRGVRAR